MICLGDFIEQESKSKVLDNLFLDSENKVYRVLEINTSPELHQNHSLFNFVPNEIATGMISNYKIIKAEYITRNKREIKEFYLFDLDHFNDQLIGTYIQ